MTPKKTDRINLPTPPANEFFEISLSGNSAKKLQRLLEVLAKFFHEGTFTLTQESMFFEKMDQGSTFLYTNILKDIFMTFKLTSEPIQFRCDLNNFSKYLNVESDDSKVILHHIFTDNFITINIQNKSIGNRKFIMKLMNLADDEEKRNIADVIKSIALPINMKFESAILFSTIKEFANLLEKDNKHCTIITENNKSTILSKANAGENEIQFELKYSLLTCDLSEKIEGSYDLDYILKLLTLAQKDIILEYGIDKPIRLTISEKESPITIIFVQAPLVDEDPDVESEEEDFDEKIENKLESDEELEQTENEVTA